MSLVGAPGSEIAEEYARILAEGDGGAYLALAAPDLDEVAAAATSAGLGPARPSSGSARFVSFPRDTAAMAVFFGDRSSVIDPASILTHANGAAGLEEVWVEGGDAQARLLVSLGAARCGPVSRGEWIGERFGLTNGEVAVVPLQPGRRPRLLGAKLRGAPAGRDWIGVLPPG